MPGKFRTTTTILGQKLSSPRFKTKGLLTVWLRQVSDARQNILAGKEMTADQRRVLQQSGFQFQVYEGDIYLNDLAAKFLKMRASEYVSSTAMPNLDHLRKYILPEFGSRNLYGITSSEIRRFLRDIKFKERAGTDESGQPIYKQTSQSLADATKQRIKVTMSLLFEYAIEEEIVSDKFLNPVPRKSRKRGSRKAKSEERLSDKIWTSEKMVESFLDASHTLGPMFYAFSTTTSNTGGRKSEMLGLQWKHSDFDNGRIRIEQILEQNSLSVVERTKSGEGNSRYVPMNDGVKESLLEWRSVSPHNKSIDYVFSRKDGRPFSPREINYLFSEACAKAKVPDIGPHGLRHNYATWYIVNGGDVHKLQKLMGHSTILTTMKYVHLAEELMKNKDRTVSFKRRKDENVTS